MGMQKMLSRFNRNEKARTKAYKLSREIQKFYANHYVAQWQQDRVSSIRTLFEAAMKNLEKAHDYSASRTSEEFMQFELDFLFASNKFREENPPGMEWHPEGVKGIFYKAFWKNLMIRAKMLGINLYGKEATPAK